MQRENVVSESSRSEERKDDLLGTTMILIMNGSAVIEICQLCLWQVVT